ncbi:MAG: DUF4492 domain-containing protein [Prevotella sp.]
MIKRIFRFYVEGFRNMKLGKLLWLVILVKLFIIFAILKLFFFHDYIGENSEKGHEAEFVATEILGE